MIFRNNPQMNNVTEFSVTDEFLRKELKKLGLDLKIKILQQNGIPTIADNNLLVLLSILESFPNNGRLENHLESAPLPEKDKIMFSFRLLEDFLVERAKGRYRNYSERAREDEEKVEAIGDNLPLILSQGRFDCLSWKGRPLFKTVYDFSLYPVLLWNLKPQTIIELGTGIGTSAEFLMDQCKTFGLQTRLITVDRNQAVFNESGIEFFRADLTDIETAVPVQLVRELKHPLLIIEDAHVNIVNILNYFHRFLQRGDYIVIEDSAVKVQELKEFMAKNESHYRVDTYYTDFFGRNMTSAPNSIFVRF